jgi:catechol 2,3-dioxygenase-like lactoylglutathione lyase family enzyme
VFQRVTLRATDREASERFYDTVLATLGVQRGGWGDFAVVQADAERPATRGLHIGFGAPSRAEVDEFWRTGTAAGYRDDGQPGPRPEYGDDYYGGFLLDPDGNSAEAVHHEGVRRDGLVDHLWIRVADVAASKRFYEAIVPRAGFRLGTDTPERAQFRGESGSFSVLTGTPTEHLEMAFPASEHDELVDPDGNLVKLVAL